VVKGLGGAGPIRFFLSAKWYECFSDTLVSGSNSFFYQNELVSLDIITPCFYFNLMHRNLLKTNCARSIKT